MTTKECILDCLWEDDEAYTEIVEFFRLVNVEIFDGEIEQTLCQMEKDGYVQVNFEWTNGYGEYPYSLTEKGKAAWRALVDTG